MHVIQHLPEYKGGGSSAGQRIFGFTHIVGLSR